MKFLYDGMHFSISLTKDELLEIPRKELFMMIEKQLDVLRYKARWKTIIRGNNNG